MNQNFLTFEFLISLTNKTLFITEFGNYLIVSGDGDPSIEDLLAMSSDSGVQLAFDLIQGRYPMYNMLKMFISSVVQKDFNKINGVLADLYLNEKSKISSYMSLISNNLKLLRKKIEQSEWLNDSGIEEHLKEFEVDIQTIYGTSKEELNIKSHKKIKWNAGPAVLATLFYDISRLKDDKGKPYFTATPSELTDVLSIMFVNEDGSEFSRDSLLTYVDPNRLDKKAKRNRIDIKDL